jgi:arylsulfatase A-like enzyme
VTSPLRTRLPTLARLLERPVTPTALGAFVVLTSAVTCWLVLAPPGETSFAARVSLAGSACQVAVLTWALGALLRWLSRRRLDGAAYAVSATLVGLGLAVDRAVLGTMGGHLSAGMLRETLEALRAGALSAGSLSLGSLAAWAGALSLLLALVLRLLAQLPTLPALDAALRRAAVPSLLLVGTAATLRACAMTGLTDARDVEAAAPWGVAPLVRTSAAGAGGGVLPTLYGDERIFAEVQERRERVKAGVRARSRPDILVVHIESLRGDMFGPEVTPFLATLANESIVPRHHLTTANKTGASMFGILDGLGGAFYALARKDHVRPLPLEILKSLGYHLSAWANLGAYEGLDDLFFGGLVDFSYQGPTEAAYASDARMLGALLATLAEAPSDAPPRFDYFILDSTHYDYSYPPEFERYTPTMTLGAEAALASEMKPRAPFIRNRYKNAILYVDSLVRKLVDTLRASGRLDRTLLIVTGDHGEEFFEHGTFGHGGGFLSTQQCEVTFLARIPGVQPRQRYTYASHADVFPTLFDAMGVESPELFMSGKSLLRYDPALDVAVSGYGVLGTQRDERRIVEGDGLIVHWIDAPPFDVTEVTDADGNELPHPPADRVADLVARALAQKGLRSPF